MEKWKCQYHISSVSDEDTCMSKKDLSYLTQMFLVVTFSTLFITTTNACSNFAMQDSFGLSARTEDMGPISFDFSLTANPATTSTLGFVALSAMKLGPNVAPLNASQGIKAGLNTAGLSCDKQTLRPTEWMQVSVDTKTIVDGALLCRWALENFHNVSSLKALLNTPSNPQRPVFIKPQHDNDFNDGHFAIRDALGHGIVIEFQNGKMNIYDDNNDDGLTGYGVMTNEPNYPWMIESMKTLLWKEAKYGPMVAMPGSWYPDARFQRLYLVKSKMPVPSNLQEAIAYCVAVLNTVTVPMGLQHGKDMKDPTDHRTQWASIYDHQRKTLYWRTDQNVNLARLQLSDVNLEIGDVQQIMEVKTKKLGWFMDAAGVMENN